MITPAINIEVESLAFDDRGLLPVIAQDAATGAVLMLAWANREAVEKTLETGLAHFWSRSRERLWQKGEISGHTLRVLSAVADCDADALLLRVEPAGPACHRGTVTCFEPNPARLELGWLAQVIVERKAAPPQESYTARLFAEGLSRMAQKVGEEGVETVIAGLDLSQDERLVSEAADLLYHLLVLLAARGVEPSRVAAELAGRHRGKTSTGHTHGRP